MNRIKKGDQVIVIAGADKGKKGTVSRIAGDKLYVENINMVKRHTKPNPQRQIKGGIAVPPTIDTRQDFGCFRKKSQMVSLGMAYKNTSRSIPLIRQKS